MEIKYLGHSSFKLSGAQAKVVTDPFDPIATGMKFPSIEADIITVSHQHPDHNKTALVSGEPLIIDIGGEYEKKGIRITGFDSFHDDKQGSLRGKNIIFKIEIDEVSILHCGDLGHALANELIEEIGEVDILLIPTGGFYTIGPDEAATVVRSIEPSVVIPMHFNHAGLNQQGFDQLSPVSAFLASMGGQNIEPIPKLVIKKSDLIDEALRIVVLEHLG